MVAFRRGRAGVRLALTVLRVIHVSVYYSFGNAREGRGLRGSRSVGYEGLGQGGILYVLELYVSGGLSY